MVCAEKIYNNIMYNVYLLTLVLYKTILSSKKQLFLKLMPLHSCLYPYYEFLLMTTNRRFCIEVECKVFICEIYSHNKTKNKKIFYSLKLININNTNKRINAPSSKIIL